VVEPVVVELVWPEVPARRDDKDAFELEEEVFFLAVVFADAAHLLLAESATVAAVSRRELLGIIPSEVLKKLEKVLCDDFHDSSRAASA